MPVVNVPLEETTGSQVTAPPPTLPLQDDHRLDILSIGVGG